MTVWRLGGNIMRAGGGGLWKQPSAGDGLQLASGHYVAQKFSMVAVYPRPDAETGTFGGTVNARHRWAYYDGSNSVRYEVPLKVFGGSPPHRYTLTAGPSGAAVGNTWNAASHGVVTWTPSTSYSTGSPASFTVRVTGQDGNFIDVSWTVATSSSTSQFIFVSNSGDDGTGTGAIGAPFATLSKVMGGGSTKTTTTYPGRVVYMRSGSYSTVAHSDGWDGGNGGETIKCRLELSSTYHPMAYVAYPDETVTVSFSGSEITVSGDDFLWSGSSGAKLIVSGSATNAAETHNFWCFSQVRVGWQWTDFDGFIPRTNANYTNSAPIFSSGSDTSPTTRNYYHAHNVQEINRTATSANDGMLWIMFGLSYWVDEYCTASRTGGPGVSFKDTCYSTSSRYMQLSSDDSLALAFMGQSGGGDNEICYSWITGPLWFNFQANNTVTVMRSYRNTIYSSENNYGPALRAWDAATADFSSDNDCVISNANPKISAGGSYPDTSGTVTAAGTECQALVAGSDKPFSSSTGLLQDVGGGTAWRTTYLGIRGWEIQ